MCGNNCGETSHAHDQPHEHGHAHIHEHAHVHDGEAGHTHAHRHTHSHAHAHGQEHSHEQDALSGHGHSHGQDALKADENLALLNYMIDHNRHHGEDLHALYHALEAAGKKEAAALVSEAAAVYEKGNGLLGAALKLL
ncbi:MAG: cobalt transporter [Oscillospiraceae bacterium]|jgi:hypothetical protein|nr:cobalt transporter [Oscillospiraceae bacterium]